MRGVTTRHFFGRLLLKNSVVFNDLPLSPERPERTVEVFVAISQWQSSRDEANGSTIRTIPFPATSQGNDPTRCIGPANGIEVVVRDAGGVTALQVELDESNHTGCGASHNAPQLTSGAYEHAVIDGGKQDGYSNGMGGVRHGACAGDVDAAEFATIFGGWKRGLLMRTAVRLNLSHPTTPAAGRLG